MNILSGSPEWVTLRLAEIEQSLNNIAGVLFKSQNASTWTADQYEDLKFIVRRASFDTSGGIARFYNAELGVGNAGTHELVTNPIQTLKPKQVLTLQLFITLLLVLASIRRLPMHKVRLLRSTVLLTLTP